MANERYDEAIRPCAEAMGRVAIEWNRLHELLCTMLVVILGRNARQDWYEIHNDTRQRDWLWNEARQRYAENADVLAKIDRLEERCRMLAGDRNNALHTPLSIIPNSEVLAFEGSYHFGHPRGAALRGKELVTEFMRCEKEIEKVGQYISTLFHPIANDLNWPNLD